MYYSIKIFVIKFDRGWNKRSYVSISASSWRLFGHILRRDREIPANKAIEGFFVPQGDKYRGRPITTLPVVLNNDLSRLESSTYCLKTSKDIDNLKKIAEQRDQWRILCTRIQKAVEALQSDDYDAERRSVRSWQSKFSAALDSLLDVNGIQGMSFVVKDFLQLTKRSMFMNSTNIFLLFTYNHARCFYNSV